MLQKWMWYNKNVDFLEIATEIGLQPKAHNQNRVATEYEKNIKEK